MNNKRYNVNVKTITVGTGGEFIIQPTSDQATYNILQRGALTYNPAFPAIQEINQNSTDNSNELFYQLHLYYAMSLEDVANVPESRVIGSRKFKAVDINGNPVADGTQIKVVIVEWI